MVTHADSCIQIQRRTRFSQPQQHTNLEFWTTRMFSKHKWIEDKSIPISATESLLQKRRSSEESASFLSAEYCKLWTWCSHHIFALFLNVVLLLTTCRWLCGLLGQEATWLLNYFSLGILSVHLNWTFRTDRSMSSPLYCVMKTPLSSSVSICVETSLFG